MVERVKRDLRKDNNMLSVKTIFCSLILKNSNNLRLLRINHTTVSAQNRRKKIIILRVKTITMIISIILMENLFLSKEYQLGNHKER